MHIMFMLAECIFIHAVCVFVFPFYVSLQRDKIRYNKEEKKDLSSLKDEGRYLLLILHHYFCSVSACSTLHLPTVI